MAKFRPLPKAVNNPVRVYLKEKRKWVGVGGDIKVLRKPPKKTEVVKEATAAEYATLKDRLPDLVGEIKKQEKEK